MTLVLFLSYDLKVEPLYVNKDSQEFVRIWRKDTDIIFTGNVQTFEEPRYSLDEDDGTTFVIRDVSPRDGCTYTCRIMLRDEVHVEHRITVLDNFLVKPVSDVVGSKWVPK